MKDRTGVGMAPTQKQVDAVIAEVVAVQKRVEGFTVSLTREQRVATTKMRPGGEGIVATLAQLAEQRGIALPEVSVPEMTANLATAQRLRPLVDTTRQLLKRLEDTVTNAQGESWWAATALYTALSRVAAASPELEAALRPVVAFFATGSRKKTPAPVTPPTASAA